MNLERKVSKVKIFKKNQIMIYIMVLILMVAGYLNYSNNTQNQISLETSTQMESKDDTQMADIQDVNDETQIADIGDAKLVNSDYVEQEENNIDEIQTSATQNNDYFVTSKLERETMYSQMLETYEKVLNSTNSLETQKQSATDEIQKINNIKNSIMICENLIKTKGFENSVIFVNGDSINVIIGTEELKPEEIAQIQNIVSREMSADIENIHIANK